MKARNSSIELLRIVAMVLIITLHMIGGDSRYPNLVSGFSWNSYSLLCLKLLANNGVSLFALITGYFGIKFSNRKLFSLVFLMYGYVILIYTVFFVCGEVPLKQYVRCFIPMSSGHWYINAYIYLMLIIRMFGNKIDVLSVKEHFQWLFVTAITIYIFRWLSFDIGTSLILLMFLYLLGRFIFKLSQCNQTETFKCGKSLDRRNKIIYKQNYLQSMFTNHRFYFILSLFLLLVLVFVVLYTNNAVLLKLLGSNYSPLILFISISLFVCVIKMPQFSNTLINKLSGGALVAYIISETGPMKAFLLKALSLLDYNVGMILSFSVCVYVVCFLINCILSKLEKRTEDKLYEFTMKVLKRIFVKVDV